MCGETSEGSGMSHSIHPVLLSLTNGLDIPTENVVLTVIIEQHNEPLKQTLASYNHSTPLKTTALGQATDQDDTEDNLLSDYSQDIHKHTWMHQQPIRTRPSDLVGHNLQRAGGLVV